MKLLSTYFVTQMLMGKGVTSVDVKDTVTPTVNAPWIEDSDNVFSIDGSQGGTTTVSYSGVFAESVTFDITYTVSAYVSGSMRINTPLANSVSRSADGEYTDTLTTTGTVNMQAFVGFEGTVTINSIVEA